MEQKSKYITTISALSNRNHDYLLELMDKYNAYSLQEITEEQAKKFLKEIERK